MKARVYDYQPSGLGGKGDIPDEIALLCCKGVHIRHQVTTEVDSGTVKIFWTIIGRCDRECKKTKFYETLPRKAEAQVKIFLAKPKG